VLELPVSSVELLINKRQGLKAAEAAFWFCISSPGEQLLAMASLAGCCYCSLLFIIRSVIFSYGEEP
jgi:hypothetical protein